MSTIDDFGGLGEGLDDPPLGGPLGWAAAVRTAIKNAQTAIAALEPWQGTQAEYDALGTYDPERTYYVIG